MNTITTVVMVAASLWWTLPPSSAETAITWTPARPVQGAIVVLRIRPAPEPSTVGPVMTVRGELAGQPLHFELNASGGFAAVGAIPVSARDSLPIQLTLDYQDGSVRELTLAMPVARARFPVERLRVASRFTTRPDAALARRVARERAQSRAAWSNSHNTPRLWTEPFLRPRPSRITSAFGLGRIFNGQLRSRHMGTDFDGDTGDPVRAANRGIVTLVGNFYYSGRLVYIDHGRGLLTAYLHLNRINVSKGELVERGQVIGKVGASGRVTGPHLHWIARYGAVTANPMSLLELTVDDLPGVDSPANTR